VISTVFGRFTSWERGLGIIFISSEESSDYYAFVVDQIMSAILASRLSYSPDFPSVINRITSLRRWSDDGSIG
jgi:hypothetical protein